MNRLSLELWNRILPETQAVFVPMRVTIMPLVGGVVELESRVNPHPVSLGSQI